MLLIVTKISFFFTSCLSLVCVCVQLAAELLLTSDVTVNFPLLKPLSAEHGTSNGGGVAMERSHISSGNVLTGEQNRLATSSSSPPSSSSAAASASLFGGPSLTLNASSALADLQEGNGGGSHPSSGDVTLSLYSFFADVFGERLCVRLSSHDRYKDLHRDTRRRMCEEHKNTLLEALPEVDNQMVTRSVDRFLEREGFKAVTVQRPRKSPPPPSSSQPRGCYGDREPWTFSLPRTVLPVTENPLEKGGWSEGQVGAGRESVQHVVKGPRVRDQGQSRRLPPVNVGGIWL